MRFLKIGLIIVVAGYGLLKGYLWYSYKQRLDKAVAQAAPFAEIHYGSIYTSLAGSVGADDIVIRPRLVDDTIRIRQFRLTAANVLSLLKLTVRSNSDPFPDHFSLAVNGLNVKLDGPLMDVLAKGAKNSESAGGQVTSIDALGCGDRTQFTLADFREMGIDSISLDLAFKVDAEPSSGSADIQVQASDPALFGVTGRLKLDTGTAKPEFNSTVPVANFTLSDYGWYNARNRFCAAQTGNDVNTYVSMHIGALGERFGLSLPDAVAKAYRNYMINGGTIAVGINPQQPVTVAELGQYAPRDAMTLLGLTLAVNDVPLDLRTISWQAPGSPAPSPHPPQAQSKAPVTAAPPATLFNGKPPAIEIPGPHYISIDQESLPRHIDQIIRVTTWDGRQREGRLIAVDSENIRIAFRRRSGMLTFPVKRSDITAVEVKQENR